MMRESEGLEFMKRSGVIVMISFCLLLFALACGAPVLRVFTVDDQIRRFQNDNYYDSKYSTADLRNSGVEPGSWQGVLMRDNPDSVDTPTIGLVATAILNPASTFRQLQGVAVADTKKSGLIAEEVINAIFQLLLVGLLIWRLQLFLAKQRKESPDDADAES